MHGLATGSAANKIGCKGEGKGGRSQRGEMSCGYNREVRGILIKKLQTDPK